MKIIKEMLKDTKKQRKRAKINLFRISEKMAKGMGKRQDTKKL